ncbi:MAG: hypothetical protein V2A73_14345 [Pseudomonadota bacterium]
MAQPQTKGLSFRSFLKSLSRLRGESAVGATLSNIAPRVGQQLREGLIFSGNWYPLSWYRDLHAAAQSATDEGLELARAIGFDSVRDDLSGIYRIFLLVVSPEYVLSKASLLFGTYFDTGRMEIVESSRGRARARWTGCSEFNKNIWADVTGGCEAAIRAAGARSVRIDLLSGGNNGDSAMELEAHWS